MIEAMKQALEALEEAVHYTSAPVWSPSMTKECNEAITSLRQAIEQTEKREWVGLTPEEILNLGAGIVNFEYAAAIEAKLKEKNT